MKKALFLAAFLLLPLSAVANGVAVLDAKNGVYLRLDSSTVKVSVQGQIAITVATQFYTNKRTLTGVTYAFPMAEQASATQLRWRVSGVWRTAIITGKPQDTTLPGGGTSQAKLVSYLGKTPLYFPISQAISPESTLTVELTYVEFLPYSFGAVSYSYPNDYQLIDTGVVLAQKFAFSLSSPRTIDSIRMTSSIIPDTLVNGGTSAKIRVARYESKASANYSVRYVLNSSQLGLFAYGSLLPDSSVPDTLGGFMAFVAEPEAGQVTATIAKVFTLIVDCSGSMSGTKMTQAKNAATYIIQNLNEGDKFNIVKFETNVASFRPTHVQFTSAARDSALAYIAAFAATNTTNISGAFDAAIPQFQAAGNNTANIVIFMTDGQPTVGVTNIPALVNRIDSLIRIAETNINLFSFGIGTDANQQLLTLISTHNSGLAEFLGNDEVYSRTTSFYNAIRNPVLLNSKITFVPPRVNEVYPDSLPNLYKGSQMIVAGRYKQGGPMKITLSGNAFGQPVSYTYDIVLPDSSVAGNEFLTKVWAKKKIESLFVRYYALTSTSSEAVALKSQIVSVSQTYGIITSFTSFSAPTVSLERDATRTVEAAKAVFLGASMTALRFRIDGAYVGRVEIVIYDLRGQALRTLTLQVRGKGEYSISWDGRRSNGSRIPAGNYIYALRMGDAIHAGTFHLTEH